MENSLENSQEVFVKTKTKTKTLLFVLEAPRDPDSGLEDYITVFCLVGHHQPEHTHTQLTNSAVILATIPPARARCWRQSKFPDELVSHVTTDARGC